MNPCAEIMERFCLCLAVQHTHLGMHTAPRQALLLPIFFLMRPPMGSGAGWIQEEDGGVHWPYTPSPSLERARRVEKTRTHSTGAIKETLTSLGPNIGVIMMLGREVSIYPPFISC